MSMYKQFKTNPVLEKSGIVLDYGDYRITVARAGGANKRYLKVLDARTKPYRRAIQMETMDPERAAAIFKQVYAETIVINWETKVDGEWHEGIESPTGGDLLPVTIENIVSTFNELNDLFMDVREQAEKSVLFRQSIQEEEGKN